MEYQNIVKDFASRTRKNLEAIRRLKTDQAAEVYEVTQLINSMLGLLVLPQQRYFNSIPMTTLEELKQRGWPIPTVRGNFQQIQNLHQLLRYLRNAIAHFNIEFIVNIEQEITGIRVWNTSTRDNHRVKTWEADLSLVDLEQITYKFIELILDETTN